MDQNKIETIVREALKSYKNPVEPIGNGLYLITGDEKFKVITDKNGVKHFEEALKKEIKKYGTTE